MRKSKPWKAVVVILELVNGLGLANGPLYSSVTARHDANTSYEILCTTCYGYIRDRSRFGSMCKHIACGGDINLPLDESYIISAPVS